MQSSQDGAQNHFSDYATNPELTEGNGLVYSHFVSFIRGAKNMATPVRLVKLKCPRCAASHWVVDNDFRGLGLLGHRELDYDERAYHCPQCGKEDQASRFRRKPLWH